jgi:soluble lytic murein transglycosylase-like protein
MTPFQFRLRDELEGMDQSAFQSSVAGRLERTRKWSAEIDAAEKEFKLPQYSLLSVIAAESGGDPAAGSNKGALGLGQFLEATGREEGLTVRAATAELPALDERLDPLKSIRAAASRLAKDLKRGGGDIDAALVNYNWGQGNYRKWEKDVRARLPLETRNHILRHRMLMQAARGE